MIVSEKEHYSFLAKLNSYLKNKYRKNKNRKGLLTTIYDKGTILINSFFLFFFKIKK